MKKSQCVFNRLFDKTFYQVGKWSYSDFGDLQISNELCNYVANDGIALEIVRQFGKGEMIVISISPLPKNVSCFLLLKTV